MQFASPSSSLGGITLAFRSESWLLRSVSLRLQHVGVDRGRRSRSSPTYYRCARQLRAVMLIATEQARPASWAIIPPALRQTEDARKLAGKLQMTLVPRWTSLVPHSGSLVPRSIAARWAAHWTRGSAIATLLPPPQGLSETTSCFLRSL